MSPRTGRLVLFNSMDARGGVCHGRSRHAQLPPPVGADLFVLQKHYMWRNSIMLGHRGPPPLRPPREPGQPCVVCTKVRHAGVFAVLFVCRHIDVWVAGRMPAVQRMGWV